jgi:hypothetical protein
LFLSETKLDAYDQIVFKDYDFLQIAREKCRNRSGGVGVFIKKNVANNFTLLDCSTENFLFLKCNVSNIIFINTYIPPEGSRYGSSTDLFDSLENTILDLSVKYANCQFCIVGDLNARSGVLTDSTVYDKYISDDNFDDITVQQMVLNNLSDLGFPIERFSMDRKCNNFGYRLTHLCKALNIFIANGRCGADAYIGKHTCIKGDGSLIDYLLLSGKLFSCITRFDILQFDPILSDVHCAIEFCLNLGIQPNNDITDDAGIDINSNSDEFYCKPIWITEANTDYRDKFDPDVVSNLLDVLKDVFGNQQYTDDSVNQLTEKVTSILTDAAKDCNLFKKRHVISKPRKPSNTWFDSECIDARSDYHKCKNIFRKNPSKRNREILVNTSRKYKKELNKKLRNFQRAIVDKIKGLKNKDPKAYWSMLNKYSNNKKEIVNNIATEAFHEHFSKLNENIANDAPDDFNVSNVSANNIDLDKPFTVEEIRRSIRLLKNNKASSSFDDVLNEYLKYAPDNMYEIFCYLFNIILDSGIFPEVWSKGIILPIYKNKGDVSDPDNYRGITILSCFGKLFTNVLNTRLNNFLENNNILCEEQAGFRKNYSTTDHIFSLKMLIDLYLSKGKKLYCSFIDYRKAFDSINRTALWQKLLSNNVDGKCIKIIYDMYKKAKSCVQVNSFSKMSDFFTSHTGVRQGENLSPVLFSLFLNDLNQFLSQHYNGLVSLSSVVNDTLSNFDVEVYFKLYILLYADDTVIFAETADELQKALDAMSSYCNMWSLQVNPAKTKIVVFCKNVRGIRNAPNFIFEGNMLEVVDSFSYLGVKFSYNGKFTKTKEYLLQQARKAMFSVIVKSRRLNLPISMQIHLFDTMVAPILLYGSEVWGIENLDLIDQFQLKFYKLILRLKQSTPNCMLYGELGVLPLSIHVKAHILCYWNRILNAKPEKICHILYNVSYKLYSDDNNVKLPWINYVHNLLDSLGMSNYWMYNIPSSQQLFKNIVKTRLRDQYLQQWHSFVAESSKSLNYRMYKDSFVFENYLDTLPYHLSNAILKFRCTNHRLPIEKGRFFGIPRDERTCHLCNTNSLGDEFHYLFVCDFFKQERRKYISVRYTSNPNTLKYSLLMNSTDKNELVKLAVYCRKVMHVFK